MLGWWMVVIATCFALPAHAQDDCAKTVYQDHNMTDYGPLAVRSIGGVIEDKHQSRIPGVCVVVFTDNGEHRMVMATRAGKDGQYVLPALPDGNYRVVASYDSLCAANVPVVVSGKAKMRPLHIIMEPHGIDACSYGELK
jgi:hypothetical protein